MHDPLTVAHRIRYPFRRKGSRYRESFVTIWHCDPESDGSDDSCGWFSPNLLKKQQSDLEVLARCEARSPWFRAYQGKEIASAADAEVLLRGVFLTVARTLRVKITLDEATRWSADLIHNPVDNIRSKLSFLPGWHSNFPDDRQEDREYEAVRLFSIVARYILRERRPWYRHPRWHVQHWKIQVHPVQKFKRWAFSRCERCGGRFRWGESPCTGSWHGTGPRWFRPEPNVYHCDCDRPGSEGVKAA